MTSVYRQKVFFILRIRGEAFRKIPVDVYGYVSLQKTMTHPATIFFSPHHPFLSTIEFEFIRLEKYQVEVKLLAMDMFVDCPKSRKLHSGFNAIVLDTIMGATVMGTLGELMPIATLNLSTRQFDQPIAGDWVTCATEIIETVDEIAQVRGTLANSNDDRLLASATGSFMIGTRGIPLNTIDKIAQTSEAS